MRQGHRKGRLLQDLRNLAHEAANHAYQPISRMMRSHAFCTHILVVCMARAHASNGEDSPVEDMFPLARTDFGSLPHPHAGPAENALQLGTQVWESVVDTDVVVPARDVPASVGSRQWGRMQSYVQRTGDTKTWYKHAYWAGQTGNLDSAQTLMEFGIVPSVTRLLRSRSPLHSAAATGDLDRLRELIEEGEYDVDEPSEDGTTPLLAAVSANQTEIVKYLLSKGAQRDQASNAGMAPLHVAATMNQTEIIRLLIEAHADIDAKHKFAGSTPLHFAAEMGAVEAIEVLCEHGADASAEKVHGGTPLHAAADLSMTDAVVALAKCGGDINGKLLGDTTPLYLAAQNGHTAVVTALLQAGADPNFEMPVTPPSMDVTLHRSMSEEFGSLDPSDPDYGFFEGASEEGTGYEHLSNFGFEAGNGATALHAAVENGHTACVKALLDGGARQAASMEGSTPLMIAAMYNRPEAAAMLLEKRDGQVLLNARLPRDGTTALYQASGNGYDGVVDAILAQERTLVDRASKLGATPLFYASGMGRANAVRLLMRKGGADPNKATKDGGTPLHAAAEQGHWLVVAELLADERTEVNAAGPDGQTALHVAARAGRRGERVI